MMKRKAKKKNYVLELDELSGKVTGYRVEPVYEYDVTATEEEIASILQETNKGNDIYYIGGKLQARERDPMETGNRIERLTEDIAYFREETKRALAAYLLDKTPEKSSILKELNGKEKQKRQERKTLEEIYALRLKEKRKKELKEKEFRYYCSLCLIIRDENEYLEEWLKWHIGQGIEHFYIYDHGSRSPVKEFISKQPKAIRERVTVHDFGGEHVFAQHEAYNDCLKRCRQESRWIGFIDTDEQVRVKAGGNICDFLKGYEEYAGVLALWVIYGADGQTEKSDRPLRERFVHPVNTTESSNVGKVFVQPLLMERMLTHNGYPLAGCRVVDEEKEEIETAACVKRGKIYKDKICIDHYYTKSYEEWLEKISRGTCDPYFSRKYEEFFKYNPDMEYCREEVKAEQQYEISEKK